jgi:hypothetical protein
MEWRLLVAGSSNTIEHGRCSDCAVGLKGLPLQALGLFETAGTIDNTKIV